MAAIAIGIATLALSAYQYFHGQSQQKKREQQAEEELLQNAPKYKVSPYTQYGLDDARSRLNAQSPYVGAAMQQKQQEAANVRGYAQKNAATGTQALDAGARSQAIANSDFASLAKEQADFEMKNRQQYYDALGGMTQQHLLGYQDERARHGDRFNWALGQTGAASNQMSQAMGLASSGLTTAANSYDRWNESEQAKKLGKQQQLRLQNNVMPTPLYSSGNQPMSVSPLATDLYQPSYANPNYSSYLSGLGG